LTTPTPNSSSAPSLTETNDKQANAAFNRANVAVGKGDNQQAIADYSEAIRLKPDYAIAFNNRANVYASLKQYDRAIADYSDYIRLRPNDPDGYNNRANYYEQLGDAQAAQRDRARAKEPLNEASSSSTPSLTETNHEQANTAFNRANVAVGKGDNQQAIADYSEAIRLKPDYAIAFNNRANVYASLKQYDRAIIDYSDYIRLRPNDPDGYNNRANCYEKLGDTQAAQRDRARAKELREETIEG
jgi:tetratricopeptide (TPR) repeat protein